jgi:hypothetical protein
MWTFADPAVTFDNAAYTFGDPLFAYSENFDSYGEGATPGDFVFQVPLYWAVTGARLGHWSWGSTSDHTIAKLPTPASPSWLVADVQLTESNGIGICVTNMFGSGYWLACPGSGTKWELWRGSGMVLLGELEAGANIVGVVHRVELRYHEGRVQARSYLPTAPRPTTWALDIADATYSSGAAALLGWQEYQGYPASYFDNLRATNGGVDPLDGLTPTEVGFAATTPLQQLAVAATAAPPEDDAGTPPPNQPTITVSNVRDTLVDLAAPYSAPS